MLLNLVEVSICVVLTILIVFDCVLLNFYAAKSPKDNVDNIYISLDYSF